ncbi:condensation domain-containing protein, partial [Kibdelosporangium lantanae]
AVETWRGTPGPVLVNLEGHGREDIVAGADVSRTVGWFTSSYPVAISGDARAVKETLHQIPDRGMGYGLLRWLNPETVQALKDYADPQIAFNYLGRYGEEAEEPAPEIRAMTGLVDMPLGYALELNAITQAYPTGDRLTATWTWSSELLTDEDVRRISALWLTELEATEPIGHTPSDLPLVQITQAEIDQLEARAKIADVLPLAPLQQGLHFHTTYDEDAVDVYTIQAALTLTGEVDAQALREAVRTLLRRHDNLRAFFVMGENARQVIPTEVDVPWVELDVEPGEVTGILAEDRTKRFDLTNPPMLRCTLIRAGGETRFVITVHHILVDGWSMPLLIGELFDLYKTHGDDSALPPVVPYRDYLAWLHLEVFSILRTKDKLKYLAGSESGMAVWINDTTPEAVAERLRNAS